MLSKLKQLQRLDDNMTQDDIDRIGGEIISDLSTRIETSWKRDGSTVVRHKQAIDDVAFIMSPATQFNGPSGILPEYSTPVATPEPEISALGW